MLSTNKYNDFNGLFAFFELWAGGMIPMLSIVRGQHLFLGEVGFSEAEASGWGRGKRGLRKGSQQKSAR
jgi:hypothetical protein